MWSFIAQSGLAPGVVDFTNALSLLGVGLVGAGYLLRRRRQLQ